MDKLVQIVNWNLPNSPLYQMYMYGEAAVESNKQINGHWYAQDIETGKIVKELFY